MPEKNWPTSEASRATENFEDSLLTRGNILRYTNKPGRGLFTFDKIAKDILNEFIFKNNTVIRGYSLIRALNGDVQPVRVCSSGFLS